MKTEDAIQAVIDIGQRIKQVDSQLEELWGEIDTILYPEEEVER